MAHINNMRCGYFVPKKQSKKRSKSFKTAYIRNPKHKGFEY